MELNTTFFSDRWGILKMRASSNVVRRQQYVTLAVALDACEVDMIDRFMSNTD